MLVALRDGTRACVRPIEPADAASLAVGLGRISAESARRRFGTPKPKLTRAELRYLTEVDGRDHVAMVAVEADEPHELMAVGRFVRLHDDPQAAEIAIVVGDPWQRQGLGRALGLQLAAAARAVGVRRWTANLLDDNRAAERLMLALGGELLEERRRAGMREITLALPSTQGMEPAGAPQSVNIDP